MTTMAIMGCGNIGSRHLQALLKLSKPLDIHVFDVSLASLNQAKARVAEIPYQEKSLHWHESVTSLPRVVDLVIIATTACDRIPLVEEAISRKCRYLILEKLVCQSNREYDRLLELCNSAGVAGWVNFNSRYVRGYRWLKSRLVEQGGELLSLTASGGNHGLACNGSHLLDIFSFLSGAQDLTILGANLDRELTPSPRGKELVDVSGSLWGRVGGSRFVVSFVREHRASITLLIESTRARYLADEVQAMGFEATAVNNWRWEPVSFEPDFVSSTTTRVVADLMERGSCDLPTLTAAKRCHTELFRVLGEHIRKVMGNHFEQCPVT